MKTLILMRHAKSSWGDPTQADIDRPLNKRGREDAGKIGRWLQELGLTPDRALVSTAERTRESWAGVTAEIGICPVDFRTELYHADAPTMLGVLRQAEGERVLMLGHNPGIGEFARRLLAEMPTAQGFADYPTAATAVIAFPVGSWAEIGWSSGRLRNLPLPEHSTERANLARMLADLDARGLIERRPDREDQRLHRLHLSPTGSPTLAGWRAQVLAEEDRRFGMLSAEERATLRRLLVRVWAPD